MITTRIQSIVKERNRRLESMMICVIGLVLVALLGCHRSQKSDSACAVSSKNESVPRTLADLNAWYVEPPPGQNAATFYLQGLNALQLGSVAASNVPLLGKGNLPAVGLPLSAPVKAAVATLIKANQSALAFFAEGAKYEHSRYPVDLSQGVDAVFPHVPKLRNAALLMELSAILHAEAHDGNQAASDILIAIGLARSLEAEPALLSQLIRAANISSIAATLEQTVNRTSLSAESLVELQRQLQSMEEYDAGGDGFNRAMTAERAMSMALVGSPQKLLQALTAPGVKILPDERERITARLQKGEKLTAEGEFLEKAFTQFMAARKASFPDRLKSDVMVRERMIEAADKRLAIIGILLPGLEGRTAREAECLAQLRLGMTAVALERFRLAHEGQCPNALSELAPDYLSATPVDPFDGQPLRYRTTSGGYVLSSIGPDLKDDSGARMNGKEGDLVFALITRAKSVK